MVLHELNELTFSFGRHIPSARRRFFVWPAHSISALPFLCLAGAFHHRAAVSLFGRRIPSPRRILFCLLVHSLPIHRFGVAVRPAHLIAPPHSFLFAGAFAADPPIWCCSVWPAHLPPIHQFGVVPLRWCICCQSTDLVLFRLAGAFPAEPPPIWYCSIWLAHSPPSRHRFGIVYT